VRASESIIWTSETGQCLGYFIFLIEELELWPGFHKYSQVVSLLQIQN
jgi:hypothetical protein